MNRHAPYSVVVAEDEPLIRASIAKKIPLANPAFIVVGEAHNGEAALRIIRELPVDLLVTDIRMPVMDGLALIGGLYFEKPELKALIVSGYDDFHYARTALQYGVRDYILKPVRKEDLQRALTAILMLLERDDADLASRLGPFPERTAQEDLAKSVAEYARLHYTERVSLESLSARFRVNPTYLARVFKAHTGTPPSRYIMDLRIQRAQRLLDEHPEMQIKEVSSLVGYDDQCYFSRIFRIATGLSPNEYRARTAPQPAAEPL